MKRQDLIEWIDGYIRAWNTNDSKDIGKLFTEDASYFTGPFDEPWRGREAIIDGWIGCKDEPNTTRFSYEILAIDGNLGVVQGLTEYLKSSTDYSNIWLIRLNSHGVCTEFREWWMEKK